MLLFRVRRGKRADKDQKGTMEHLENMDTPENLDTQGPKDLEDQKDILDYSKIAKNVQNRLQLKGTEVL